MPDQGPAAGGGQPLPRLPGDRVVRRHPELGAIAARLLQVVAEDLVELDQIAAVLGEPAGEALVQLRPRRLRERVVGGVADQQVPEAEGVLAGKLALVGADELLANERGQARHHLRLLGGQRLDRAAMEDAPLDRAPLEHVPLGRIQLVEAGGQQCLDRRRHGDLAASRLGHERDHLLDVERVPLGRVEDPAAQVVVEVGEVLDQLPGLLRRRAARAARWSR